LGIRQQEGGDAAMMAIRFIGAPPVVANTVVANKPVVANKAKSRTGDRHKDVDARRAYQRKLMAARRALAKTAGGAP